jgi:uncharacterized membrane protein
LKEITVRISLDAIAQFLGRLHPALVHFPIALLAVAALLEGIQVLRRAATLSPATRLLCIPAALAAVTSSALGLLFKLQESTEGALVALHGWVALSATIMSVIAAIAITLGSTRPRAVWSGRAALAVGTPLVLGAGFLGGELVFGPSHLFEPFVAKPSPCSVKESAGAVVDFEREIAPILSKSCLKCHGPAKQKGHFRLDYQEDALRGGEDGPAIVPGHRSRSPLYTLLIEKNAASRMPQKSSPLRPEEIELIGRWIEEGAHWPKGVVVR